MQPPKTTLTLRVDESALAHNWRALDALSGEACAGAAVKADCYGLGVDRCVPTLRDAGCETFFVAHWSEVEAVARHVPAQSIAVLHGPVRDDDVAYAKASGAAPVINSLAQARRWVRAGNGQSRNAQGGIANGGGGRCHLMVDTGINRLGVAPGELSDPIISRLEVDILMSHLASADEDNPANAEQLAAFRACLPLVPHNRASLANSAGIALGGAFAFDLTRPGLALYGGVPRPELRETIKQVAFLQAAIMQVRNLDAGDRVGYNGQFTAPRKMKVGTVSIGYADGFLRARGTGNAFTFGDVSLPICGKVSMDMVVIDLSNAPDLDEGDWVEVPFDLPIAAQQSSVSQYELLTTLGSRWS